MSGFSVGPLDLCPPFSVPLTLSIKQGCGTRCCYRPRLTSRLLILCRLGSLCKRPFSPSGLLTRNFSRRAVAATNMLSAVIQPARCDTQPLQSIQSCICLDTPWVVLGLHPRPTCLWIPLYLKFLCRPSLGLAFGSRNQAFYL